jgi:uncharacterized protein YozE (UPF0346 family)
MTKNRKLKHATRELAAATDQNYTAVLRADGTAEASDIKGFDEWCALFKSAAANPIHAPFLEWLVDHEAEYFGSADGFDFFLNRPGSPEALSTSLNWCCNAYNEWVSRDGTFLGWAYGSDDFTWNDDVHRLSDVIFSDTSEFPHTADYNVARAYLRSLRVERHIIDSFDEQWMNWQMFYCAETNGFRNGKCKSDLGWDETLFIVDVPLPAFHKEADWLWATGFVTTSEPSPTDPANDVSGQQWHFAHSRELLAAEEGRLVLPAVQLSSASHERNTNWTGSGYVLATTWSGSESD